MDSHDVAIIGGGLGGLAAAALLAKAGRSVVVIEQNARTGGKMHVLAREGFRWDTGPSLLTMPHVLEELWADCGGRLEDDLELIRLPTTCRYRWTDGTRIDEDESFWQRPDVSRFLEYAAGLYEISADTFLHNRIEEWWRQLLRPSGLRSLRHFPKIASFRTLAEVVERSFDDPHVRQIFLRFATYNGSSPYRTPSAFNIIPFVQARFGGWFVRGGMQRIAEQLEALGRRLGAGFRLETRVESVQREGAGFRLGLATSGGAGAAERPGSSASAREPLLARHVICNQDVLAACEGILAEEAPRLRARLAARRRTHALSTAGLVTFAAIDGHFPDLVHHNIFFSDDYPGEFASIFDRKRPADFPTIYIANSCRTDRSRAPEGSENWFVLVNAPATTGSDIDWPSGAGPYTDRILDLLGSRFGLGDVAGAVRFRETWTPADFERRFGSLGGALYGFASHGVSSAFRRPPMAPREVPGLWFVGGSTHPGGGVPLVLLSGRLAARGILGEKA